MIFDERRTYKPFEFEEPMKIVEFINNTYWLHKEVVFESDIVDVQTLPNKYKQGVIRSLLGISTIEVKVKPFWGSVGDIFPKPEISFLGFTHAECEVRHAESYSRILTLLGLEGEFEKVLTIPAIEGRYQYLDKYLKYKGNDRKKNLIKVVLFSVLIENVSLFSQFATVAYLYSQHDRLEVDVKKGIMKDIFNIIKWTAIDEQIHFQSGAFLVNTARKELPELFDEEFEDQIIKACQKSVKYESNILDWVFEDGEWEGLTKSDLLDFMKSRVNESLETIGMRKAFNEELNVEKTKWFKKLVFEQSMPDFFALRPADYTVNQFSKTDISQLF